MALPFIISLILGKDGSFIFCEMVIRLFCKKMRYYQKRTEDVVSKQELASGTVVSMILILVELRGDGSRGRVSLRSFTEVKKLFVLT